MDHASAQGITALFIAASQGHREVVQCLHEAGANVNRATAQASGRPSTRYRPDARGISIAPQGPPFPPAPQSMTAYGVYHVCNYICTLQTNPEGERGWTALLIAAADGDLPMVRPCCHFHSSAVAAITSRSQHHLHNQLQCCHCPINQWSHL